MADKVKKVRKDKVQASKSEQKGVHLDVKRDLSQSTCSPVFKYLKDPDSTHQEPSSPYILNSAKAPVQNMQGYDNPPTGLPIIIREKELTKKQKTMKHFVQINDFSQVNEDIKKKEFHASIHRDASINFVNNISSIAASNYTRKKNQGLMLVNELWGQKYHKSIMHISGLVKDQYYIKGKSRMVASKRLNQVQNYYEEKHKDEIKNQREFLELLVVPSEEMTTDSALLKQLNLRAESPITKNFTDDLCAKAHTRRHSSHHSPSASFISSSSPTVKDVKYSQFASNSQPRPGQFETTPSKAEVSTQNNTIRSFALSSDSKDEQVSGNYRALIEKDSSSSSNQDTNSIFSLASRPNLELTYTSSTAGGLSKINEEKELDGDSPIHSALNFKSKLMNSKPKTSLPSRRLFIKTDLPVKSSMAQKKASLSPKFQGHFLKTSSNANWSPMHEKSSAKSARLSYNTNGFSDHKRRSLPFALDIQKFPIHKRCVSHSNEYLISPIFLSPKQQNELFGDFKTPRSTINTSKASIDNRTSDMDRLFTSFQNFMFYCDEVRDDDDIKKTMQETWRSTKDMFSTPREKFIRSTKEPQESLETVLRKTFHMRANSGKGHPSSRNKDTLKFKSIS